MVVRTIEVPDISFASFYYPEILRDALAFFRRKVAELGLTDENEIEVHIQLIRAFAFVGHLNNTRLDTVATELLMDSLTLLESLKRLLRLIGIEVSSATPATVDLLLTLSEVITADTVDFIPDLAEFGTDAVPPIPYEALGGQDLNRTDEVDFVYALERNRDGTDGVFSTTSPGSFQSATAAFIAADVGRMAVFETATIFGNNGRFRIVELISATEVRLVRIPDSEPPGLETETGLTWRIMAFSANGASDVNTLGAPYFTPWATPAVADALYIGHEHALWNRISLVINTIAVGVTGTWEYFDNQRSRFNPKTVTDNLDGTLTFDISSLVGLVDVTGVSVVVEYTPTNTKEIKQSVFASSENRITTATYLGQVAPSVDPTDYLITADWIPLDNLVDSTISTASFEVNADVDYDLPQTRERSWLITDINLQDAHWARFRIVSVAAPTSPILDTVDIDQNEQFLVVVGTQGETIGPKVIGSSDGTQSQGFELPDNPLIDGTETIEVDEGGGGTFVEWTRQANFLSSLAASRHYVRESNAEGVATIRFGDGTAGKIPPVGVDNIRATSRIGADEDGNVGANTVVVNSDGTPQISEVTNPRAAKNWKQKDGGTEADIERLKRDAPAALRTRETGSNEDDVERLAIKIFVDRNGARPVARAFAEPEGFGPKTVKLLVVGAGGTTLSGAEKADLEEFYNGDRTARPPVKGKISLNNQVTAVNFEPRPIVIVATVTWPNGNAESIRSALLALLTPLSLEEDGTTFTWDFAGTVGISRVYSEIHAVDPTIIRVPTLTLNGVAASVALITNQLPTSIAASINVSIQQS